MLGRSSRGLKICIRHRLPEYQERQVVPGMHCSDCLRQAEVPEAGRTLLCTASLSMPAGIPLRHCRVHIEGKEQRLLPQRPSTPVLQGLAALGHA